MLCFVGSLIGIPVRTRLRDYTGTVPGGRHPDADRRHPQHPDLVRGVHIRRPNPLHRYRSAVYLYLAFGFGRLSQLRACPLANTHILYISYTSSSPNPSSMSMCATGTVHRFQERDSQLLINILLIIL